MTISEHNIINLLNEAKENVYGNPMELYAQCIERYVDETALLNSEGLTATEIAVNFALAGYCIGVEDTLRNLDWQLDNDRPGDLTGDGLDGVTSANTEE